MLLPKIVFPLPAGLRAEYPQDADRSLFSDDNLIIYISPDRYTPIFEGEQTNILDGLFSSTIVPSSKRYGFEASTNDGRLAIYYILDRLVRNSYLSPGIVSPIRCLDFVFSEQSPQGYAERWGIITDLTFSSGTLINNNRALSTGIKFKFLEIARRFV